MRYQKIEFIEWRDPPGASGPAVSDEIAAGQKKLAELGLRESQVRADIAHTEALLKKVKSEQLGERLAQLVMEADNVYVAGRANRQALEAAGVLAEEAMRKHPRVGAVGFMVIDEKRGVLVSVVDEAGAELPAGAVYGYKVVDLNPNVPAWAEVQR